MSTHNTNTIRLFVALPLPKQIKIALQEQQDTLRKHLGETREVRFVPPDNFHLTLRFFGDVPTGQEEALIAALQSAGENTEPLNLHLGEAGCFPSAHRPRVIWTGIGGDLKRLRELQQRVSQATAQFGQPPESRPYSPHLTLARVQQAMRETKPLAEGLRIINEHHVGTSWTSTEVALYQSVLQRSGAEYSIRARFQLKGKTGI